MSAVAAWKAKQNFFNNPAISEVSQHTSPPNQDKQNYAVPPPAKKQKTEPQGQPSGPDAPRKKNKPKVRRPPLPVPKNSQSSAQSTGTRESPIFAGLEDASGTDEVSEIYEDTGISSREIILEDGHGSDSEQCRIGDSE